MNTKLTTVELDLEEVQVLPEREALGFFNVANITANNTALALNAGTAFSLARAVAVQTIVVSQS
jgi:hypothetical protein